MSAGKTSLYHPRHLPSWLMLAILRLLVMLPLSWQYRAARAAGRLAWHFFRRRRQITLVNAELCFPEWTPAQRETFAREVMIAGLYGVVETALSWWASDKRLAGRYTLEGGELIEQAQAEGRGVLLLGLHLTTLDLAGRLFSSRYATDVTYRSQNDPVFDYYIEKYRRRRFANMVEKREMRRMIRLLKDSHIVWYAIDQNYGKKNFVFAPFFGQQAATLAGTGKILRMTGARPLLFSHYREFSSGKVHYRLSVSDPFKDGFGEDETDNATLLNRAYEQAIRKHPEQYMWTHRRFKTRPDNAPSPYPRKKRKKRRQK